MLNLQTKNWSQLLNLFMNEEDLLLLEAWILWLPWFFIFHSAHCLWPNIGCNRIWWQKWVLGYEQFFMTLQIWNVTSGWQIQIMSVFFGSVKGRSHQWVMLCPGLWRGSSCPYGHALKQHNPVWTSVRQLLSFMKNLWFQFWFHSSFTKNGTLGPVLVWFFEKKNSGSGSVLRQHCSGPVLWLHKIWGLAKMLAFVRSQVSDSSQVGEHFFSSDCMKILFDSILGWWDEMHQNQR
jgi:hypothetical protein